MLTHTKKFFLLLCLVVLFIALLFIKEWRRTTVLVTRTQAEPLISPTLTPIPLLATDPILGNPGAPLVVIEFSDLGDSASHNLHRLLTQTVRNHPQNMQLVWKDAPLASILFSQTHQLAHQAALCAGAQKKFWPFVDRVVAASGNWHEAQLKAIADELKLDVPSWWQCTTAAQTKKTIADAAAFAQALGVKSVPTIFVNNKKLNLTSDINVEQLLTSFIAK